jgi:hypothetical protein
MALEPLWTLDGESARRKAATYTQNERTQTSMPRVRFEPMIPAFERAKTVHALDRAATVIGWGKELYSTVIDNTNELA